VISIALNANMKPTSALIAENSSAAWLAGAAALANSVLSKSAGSTFSRPAANRVSAART